MPDPAALGSPVGVQPYGFTDVCEYIERITHAIWNGADRDPELIRRYYGPHTSIHIDAGDLTGAGPVIANTHARLRAFPDFHGTIDDTIWTGTEDTGYRTSMRWTWTATNTGPSTFGPPTGRPVRFSAIANCVVRGEVIIEEWLSSNPLALARQLGLGDRDALTQWATGDPHPGTGTRPRRTPALHGPGLRVAEIWDATFNGRDLQAMWRGYRDDATQHRGPGRVASTPADIRGWFGRWLALCPDLTWTVDDSYWLAGDETTPDRVATQWTLRGEHAGAPVRIAGISHHHLRGGLVVQEWTEYDELTLLRQCDQLA